MRSSLSVSPAEFTGDDRGRIMMRMFVIIGVLCVAAAIPPAAHACPVCNEPLGQQVRAGIFDEGFRSNLIATMLPFAVFLGVVAASHGGGVREREDARPPTSAPADHARTQGERS
jgi:hypothetical protein